MIRQLAATTCCLAVFATVGCGPPGASVSPGAPAERPTEVPSATGLVTTSEPVFVVGTGARGDQLCFSTVTEFGPPVCSDADVVGWDWSEHIGDFEDSGGKRWGTFLLTGEFDGVSFTPSEVRPGSAYEPDSSNEPDSWSFEIPCAEPLGGWQVADPARTTPEAALEMSNAADWLPGFAMETVSYTDGSPGPPSPQQTVITVYVAGDPVAAEKLLRTVWGGMLCVLEVKHSAAELERIQMELGNLPGSMMVGSGSPNNQVDMTVFYDDGSYQRWADAEYGEGLVDVSSILQPAD